MHQIGRPVLVGTTTIEKSELLAALLSEYNISYQLLNAKPKMLKGIRNYAQAGCKNAVTISTNMAGRGTDILLGGNPEIRALSVLKVLFKDIDLDSGDDLLVARLKEKLEIFDNTTLNSIKDNYPALIKELSDSQKTEEELKQNPLYAFYQGLVVEQSDIVKSDKRLILGLGGLHVIGTERHESRRIDNQLRGRSGRQGDPGSSRFFLSLEDKLLRLFGGEQILGLMQNIGFQEDTPIQSPLLNQSLESAQRKVESYYFDTRKQLFEYDQALTLQRNGVYMERRRILQRENVRDWIIEYAERSLSDLVAYMQQLKAGETTVELINVKVQELLGIPFKINLTKDSEINTIFNFLQQQFQISYDLKEIEIESIEKGLLRELERTFLLQQIDYSWKEHLKNFVSSRFDPLASLRAKNPLTEYKKEAFNFFILMLTRIRHRVVYFVLRSKIILD